MTEDAKKKIQIALALAIVISGLRAGYILYRRHEDYLAAQKQQQAKDAGYSNADYYVAPKKLHPYDLKSARQLMQQPVWAAEGYRYTYYPYDPVRKRADFKHDAGLLRPLERLQIKDIVADQAEGKRQVIAVFEREGKSYAVPIGTGSDGQYRIYSDEMFYIEDPHELYKHWPADVWHAVDQHEIMPGMDELQATFAVGMGVPDAGTSADEKTVRYPNGGKPLVVTYQGGKVAEVKAES